MDDDVREVLIKARNLFRKYEEHHRTKGMAGDEKAAVNAAMADEIDEVLGK